MQELLNVIESLMTLTTPLIAIDGPCAAGKSTLADKLAKLYPAAVYHMDDFFLLPEQRSAQRLALPGGNVDHERFLREVLLPLRSGEAFEYRAYNCQTGSFEPRASKPADLIIIEGAYCLHPSLQRHYDLKVFLDVDPDTQASRIVRRNGEAAARRFFQEWIPLENAYFDAFGIRELCDIHLAPVV
ncbi:MAG: uridine kinase [Christensenellales bacterium]